MSSVRTVSGTYLRRNTQLSRRGALGSVFTLGAVLLHGEVAAAPVSVRERTQTLINELNAAPALKSLVEPAVQRSTLALSRAGAEGTPRLAALLEETALEWAEVARDLARASEAEASSDRLETELSALQTELARVRATVEQTKARVGRAQQDLTDLKVNRSTP